MKLQHGLTVAYLSGTKNEDVKEDSLYYYKKEDIEKLNTLEGPIDVLLTYEPLDNVSLFKLKPQYYFYSKPTIQSNLQQSTFYYEPKEKLYQITRTMPLPSSLSGDKKWFYAFKIIHGDRFYSKSELPLDAIPFSITKKRIIEETQEPNFLFDMNPINENKKKLKPGYVCNKCKIPGHYIIDCPNESKVLK